MTCADKFRQRMKDAGETIRVAPEEVDGRPVCDHPGCGRKLRGDGTCVAGHRQVAQAGVGAADAETELLAGLLCMLDTAAAEGGAGKPERTILGRPGALLARYVVAQERGEVEQWWVAEARLSGFVERRWLINAQDEAAAQEEARRGHRGAVVQPLATVVRQMVPGAPTAAAQVALRLLHADLRERGSASGESDPREVFLEAYVEAAEPEWEQKAGTRREQLAKLLSSARGVMDSDPGLAAYMVRDLPETRAAGLTELAWTMTREGVHRNDVVWLFELLDKEFARYGPLGMAGPRTHGPRVPPEPYPADAAAREQRRGAVLLLERDGVVLKRRQKTWGTSSATTPEEVELEPTGVEAILAAQAAGAYVALVTNQDSIGLTVAGETATSWQQLTEEGLGHVHQELLKQLAQAGVDVSPGRFRIYYCPHAADANCACRTPHYGQPGGTAMLTEVLRDFNVANPADCLMVGDMATHWQAARNAGLPFALSQAGEQGAQEAYTALRLASALEPLLTPKQAVAWWVLRKAQEEAGVPFPLGQRVRVREAGAATAVVLGVDQEQREVAWADEWGNVLTRTCLPDELQVVGAAQPQ